MRLSKIFFGIILFVLTLSARAADVRYVGGDISMYPYYQKVKSIYKDINGKNVDFLEYSKESGMNTMRVRLFVNPSEYTIEEGEKKQDSNVCQSLEYIIPLCKEIIKNGMEIMLDFHYSDTWADPEKQYTPDAWANLDDNSLANQIYSYTQEVLQRLKENDIYPAFIQPGNEISFGMCWGPFGSVNNSNICYINSPESSWNRFGNLLKSAIKACREVMPQSKIIIHSERIPQQNVMTDFFDRMSKMNIDYDIIGLSYYPYFHGKLSVLDSALTTLEKRYPEKPIMLVEAGYPLYWEVPGSSQSLEYQLDTKTDTPQYNFSKDFVDILLKHENVNGLFWWWMEYNPFNSKLEGWYNAPLIDPNTGKVTKAFATIASFGTPLPEDSTNPGDGNDSEEDKKDEGDNSDNSNDSQDPDKDKDNPATPDNGNDKDNNSKEDNKDNDNSGNNNSASSDNNQNNDNVDKNPGGETPDNNPEQKPEDSDNGSKDEQTPEVDPGNDNNPAVDPDDVENNQDTEDPSVNEDDENKNPEEDMTDSPEDNNPDDQAPDDSEGSAPADTPDYPDYDDTVIPDADEDIDPGFGIDPEQPEDSEKNDDDNNISSDPENDDQNSESETPDPDDTGIDTIYENPLSSDKWFDLMGNTVYPPLKPGLYIHNNKKIIIR